MKYEMIFGDQSLFDGAGLFTGIDIVTRSVDDGLYRTSRLSDETSDSLKKAPIVAMRRIIKEPKRWTVEDQKAGRLPPAGSKYLVGMHNIELECLYNDSKGNVWGFDAQGEVYGFAIKYCSPIETQAEKAQRLRDEWRIKALSSASILSGMQEYELKRLGGYIGDIYDALLSGELTMPSKDGE